MRISEILEGIDDFEVPSDGDCSGLLNEPGSFEIGEIHIDESPYDKAIRIASDDLDSNISLCEVCGVDTYDDIVVGWARLAKKDKNKYGFKLINGYRLCDKCARRAMKEDKDLDYEEVELPYIDKLVMVHRTNDKGETSPSDVWKRITRNHCGFLKD